MLVCSCVRGFFQQLKKVRAPAAASSDDAGIQAGSYLRAMAQSHHVCGEFMSAQWRSHSSIAGIINYHVFKFMVPLSAHTLLKEELVAVRKLDRERQTELSKLQSRLLKLENKK